MAVATLKVLTFNIRLNREEKNAADNWTGERSHAVVKLLLDESPDVLGLQEAQPEQLQFVARALAPTYAFVGVGRDMNGLGEASPIFFKTSRLDLVRCHVRWLSETPLVAGSKYPFAGCTRVVTCALLRERSGSEVCFFNTHLDHVGMNSGGYKIQEGQGEILCGLVDDFCAGSTAPRVVMGDLNSHPTAGAVPVLRANYQDTCPLASHGVATFVDFEHDKEGSDQHIDWIFVRGCLDFREYKILDRRYTNSRSEERMHSDHLAVGVSLDIPQLVKVVDTELVWVDCCMGQQVPPFAFIASSQDGDRRKVYIAVPTDVLNMVNVDSPVVCGKVRTELDSDILSYCDVALDGSVRQFKTFRILCCRHSVPPTWVSRSCGEPSPARAVVVGTDTESALVYIARAHVPTARAKEPWTVGKVCGRTTRFGALAVLGSAEVPFSGASHSVETDFQVLCWPQ